MNLTFTCKDLPFSQFAQWFVRSTGFSLVGAESLDKVNLSLSFKNQSINSVLQIISRRYGVAVTRHGDIYYLGPITPSDRGLLVKKVSRLDSDQLKHAIAVQLSDIGRQITYPDGLVVVGDRVEVLDRVNKLLTSIESAPTDVWVVQLYLISISDSASTDLGLDVTPSADLSLNFAVASRGILDDSTKFIVELDSSLRNILHASRTVSGVKMVAEPLFLLLDGETGKFSNGKNVPVPKKTVSNEGTVTTSGFDIVETGQQMAVSVRQVGKDSARVDVDINISDIVGYVEDAPITDTRSYKGVSVASSGGVYLVGSLSSDSRMSALQGAFSSYFQKQNRKDIIQIWLRCYRVAGSVNVKKTQPGNEIFNGSADSCRNMQTPGNENLKVPFLGAKSDVKKTNTKKLGFCLPDEPCKLSSVEGQ